jgi:hypothetical protein
MKFNSVQLYDIFTDLADLNNNHSISTTYFVRSRLQGEILLHRHRRSDVVAVRTDIDDYLDYIAN